MYQHIRLMRYTLAVLGLLLCIAGCTLPSVRTGIFGSASESGETAPPLSGTGTEFTVELTENSLSGSGGSQVETAPEMTRTQARQEADTQRQRRQNFRAVIQKGDYFFVKEDKDAALAYYLDAYKKLGSDHVLESKIGRVYFGMKKFVRAYDYFRRIPASIMEARDKELLLLSLLSLRNDRVLGELDRLRIQPDERAYYRTMFTCLSGTEACVNAINTYTGSFIVLTGFQGILTDSATISPDIFYRNIRLAGAIFQNREYSVAATLAEEVLRSRPDYRVALKIAAYSRYKLGEYDSAKILFQRLYGVAPDDTATAYALGLTMFHLGDYVSSSLYYNAAVINGYTPKTELERRLVYNYTLLGDTKNALKVFRFLLVEDDVTADDYYVGIYTAIQERDFSRASIWIARGMKQFSGNEMFPAFSGMIAYLKGDPDAARGYLRQALTQNPRSVVALLYMGRLFFDGGQYTLAKTYFENALTMNPDGNFGEEAKKYLEQTNYRIASGTLGQSGALAGSGTTGSLVSSGATGTVTSH